MDQQRAAFTDQARISEHSLIGSDMPYENVKLTALATLFARLYRVSFSGYAKTNLNIP
jgi:hypothetical protein